MQRRIIHWRVFILSLMVFFSLSTVSPASAAVPAPTAASVLAKIQSSSDPQRTYQALTPAERAAFDLEYAPAAMVPLPSPATSPPPYSITSTTKCWEYARTWNVNNQIGKTLFTYWSRVRWCSDGIRVTSATTSDRGGETRTPFYHFRGNLGSGSLSLYSENRRYVQERFTFEVPSPWGNVVVSDYVYCAQLRVGTTYERHSGLANCNLYA